MCRDQTYQTPAPAKNKSPDATILHHCSHLKSKRALLEHLLREADGWHDLERRRLRAHSSVWGELLCVSHSGATARSLIAHLLRFHVINKSALAAVVEADHYDAALLFGPPQRLHVRACCCLHENFQPRKADTRKNMVRVGTERLTVASILKNPIFARCVACT